MLNSRQPRIIHLLFPGKPALGKSPPQFSLIYSSRETAWIHGTDFFTVRTSFLSPKKQWQCIAGNNKHWCQPVVSFTFNLPPNTHTHTHTHLTALCLGLPRWTGTSKVQPIWILLKQETVSRSGISWDICKSAPCPRQTTMPACHHSVCTGRMPFLPPNQQRQSTEGLMYHRTPEKSHAIRPLPSGMTIHTQKTLGGWPITCCTENMPQKRDTLQWQVSVTAAHCW